MAWPFSKPKLKIPQPPAPKIPKQVHKVSFSSVMSGEHQKIQEEQEHIKEKLGDIKVLAKKHGELSSSLESHKKNFSVLEKEFDEHREEMMDEIKSINKNLGPLYDKDVALEKDIKELETMDKKLLSEIQKVERKTKDVKDIIQDVENAFNPESLKKLKASINEVAEFTEGIAKKDENQMKRLQSIDRKIGVVERHAEKIDDEKQAMKESAEALAQHAEELKATVGGYADQLIELSGKTSANIAKTADLDEEFRALLKRLEAVEGQLVAASELSKVLQQHSNMLAEIAKRLEYLERTTTKTVVLD